MTRTSTSLAIVLLLAGCAMPTAPTAPADIALPELPARWSPPTAQAHPAQALTTDWWRAFGSAELNGWIEQAQAQSLDLAAAVARVREAGAATRIAGAALLPAVSASIDASRQGRLGGSRVATGSSFAAGFAASYELDFWGGHRARHDAAQAMLQASGFDHDTVRLTVTAGVASAWLQAVALRERIRIAEGNLRHARRLLELVESRERAGAAAPLELAQQRGLAAAQERALAALHQQAEDARTALAVLLGEPAGVSGLAVRADTLERLTVPSIEAGLPSELLARRPDIARAEAQLAAADADVAVARAAMLPSVTLAGSVGTGGDRLRRILDNPLYSLAAGLTAPIFDAGRLAAGRDVALARREELLASYRAAIVAAFGDVAAALNAVAGIDAQRMAQAVELEQAGRAAALAESRYRAGAETLLTLLDAQRTLYAAQDAAVQLKALRLQASVGLYKALGGGWGVLPVRTAGRGPVQPLR